MAKKGSVTISSCDCLGSGCGTKIKQTGKGGAEGGGEMITSLMTYSDHDLYSRK